MVKLNIGCGFKKFPNEDGWINTDIVISTRPDVLFNLEHGIPFKDESIDHIYLDNVVEHIENIYLLFSEISRVLKTGGTCEIRVPHYRSYNSYTDPTHKHFFTTKTFEFLVTDGEGSYYRESEHHKRKLKIKYIKIVYAGGILTPIRIIVEPIANLMKEIFERYFPLAPEQIHVLIEKV